MVVHTGYYCEELVCSFSFLAVIDYQKHGGLNSTQLSYNHIGWFNLSLTELKKKNQEVGKTAFLSGSPNK